MEESRSDGRLDQAAKEVESMLAKSICCADRYGQRDHYSRRLLRILYCNLGESSLCTMTADALRVQSRAEIVMHN